jgi:hypothetical protein
LPSKKSKGKPPPKSSAPGFNAHISAAPRASGVGGSGGGGRDYDSESDAGRGGSTKGAEIPESCPSKKCNCKRSRCLKLYCECFAAGAVCDGCSCQNCQNTLDHADLISATRQQIQARNPLAFADEIEDGAPGAGDGRHKKGCSCRKSVCLQKYCQCFQAGVLCQECCKCEGCKNNKYSNGGDTGGAEEAVDIAFVGRASPAAAAAAAAAAATEVEAALMSDEEPVEAELASDEEANLVIEELREGCTGAAMLAAEEELGTFLPQSPSCSGGDDGSGDELESEQEVDPQPHKRKPPYPDC